MTTVEAQLSTPPASGASGYETTRRVPRARISQRDWLALSVGLTNPFTIRLVGLMPVSEIILLVAGAMVFLRTVLSHRFDEPLTKSSTFRLMMICQAVALFGYILSDFWRDRKSVV